MVVPRGALGAVVVAMVGVFVLVIVVMLVPMMVVVVVVVVLLHLQPARRVAGQGESSYASHGCRPLLPPLH